MAMASLLISAAALFVSMSVAWLTLFRRGAIHMTQPFQVGFLYEHDQPKVFLRSMLYTTGKRGYIIEALYLKALSWANRRCSGRAGSRHPWACWP